MSCPPLTPLHDQVKVARSGVTAVADPDAHRPESGSVQLAAPCALPHNPGCALATFTRKVALVSLMTVASSPPLVALAAVGVVSPLRRISTASRALPAAPAIMRTVISSPLATTASVTQDPPLT